MRGITLLFCSVLLTACDDGTTAPGGEGGAGGEAGAAGAAGEGEGGEGGGGALTEACDHVTRCATEGALCLLLPPDFEDACVVHDVPIGEPCESDEDCQGGVTEGYCTRDSALREKFCSIHCYADTGCPVGLVCAVGGFTMCIHPEE